MKNESIICTLRVCSKTFDAVKFLKKNKWKVNNFWVKGEKGLLSHYNRSPGKVTDEFRRFDKKR